MDVFADVCVCVEKAYKVMPSLPDSLNIPLKADPEELSKGTYPGPEGRTFDDFLLPSFKLFKLGITVWTSMCLN